MKVNNDQPSVSSKQGQVVSNLEAELIKSRRKCEELERKLQLLVESSEAKHIHLLGNQSQLEKEMERCKKEKSLL